MRGFAVWACLALFSLLVLGGLADDFKLSDAFDDPTSPTPKQKENEQPGGGVNPEKPTQKPAVKPKEPVKSTTKPKEENLADFFGPTVRSALLPRTSARPLRPSAPSGKTDPLAFDLADALPENNKKNQNDKDFGGGDSNPGIAGGNGGKGLTDDDLYNLNKDGSYHPDKGTGGKKGSGGSGGSDSPVDPADDGDYDSMAETGTIAGIVSAVAMALLGAVSSYISYQKKKFCFSIQQSLNADMVKAENPEAVVAQEPQVQQTLLQPPNAEPPTEDNAV
ncbi:CD99 antigen-like protein 2 isoform X1 [Tachysurus vachellii]|uniref:CD99 antigen-like protein 2 isoform X1 n=1 Tax=Tachysurus vachellii TaxID=175792 RepID=UPI00296ADA8A|nr:CD99 antigen-like protein 2 isoform X1 [Tachysurus vachellii]